MEIVANLVNTVFTIQAVRDAINLKYGSYEDVLTTILSGLKDGKTAEGGGEKAPKSTKAKSKSHSSAAGKAPPSELEKMTIGLLKEKCKSLGIKPVGNKQSLIDKISEHMNATDANRNEENDVMVLKDEQGLYVHPQTGLIFNPNDQVVVAYKDKDGTILPLDAEHVEICQQYGFEYRIDED